MTDHRRRRPTAAEQFEEAAPPRRKRKPTNQKGRNARHRETPLCSWMEVFQYLFLLIPIVAVGFVTYHFSSQKLEDDFAREFQHVSDQVVRESTYRLGNQFSFLETLGLTATASTLNQKWPLITIPDFSALTRNYRNQSQSQAIVFAPLVYADNLTDWEVYAADRDGITPFVFKTEGNDRVPDTSNPSAPIWQVSPDIGSDNRNYNYNLLHTSWIDALVQSSLRTKQATLSEPLPSDALFSVFPGAQVGRTGGEEQSTETWSILAQPVWTTLEEDSGLVEDGIGGFLISVIPWSYFLRDILWNEEESVICVVRDSLNYAFSYQLVGPQAHYLGPGDSYHDSKWYPDHFATIPFVSDRGSVRGSSRKRHLQYESTYTYTLEVYPTDTFYDYYVTKEPWIYAGVVVAIFAAVVLWFLCCTCCQKCRESRDRAFEDTMMDRSALPGAANHRSRPNRSNVPENNKQRLNAFLTDNSSPNMDEEDHTNFSTEFDDFDLLRSKPVADFFPNASLMMADITNFSAFVSTREPSQVFYLLETVYDAFNVIAKRRKVFKVETIGDCYVAVAGLPDPRPDHALAMAQFARSCMQKFWILTHKLEEKLGPETTELGLRVGIHSGAITAGVLRSDQARFQLFGETVNVTNQIENTGIGGRIHLSKETANHLTAAGKGHWLQRRRDTIYTKTGEIQTFWLLDEDSPQRPLMPQVRTPRTYSEESTGSMEDSSFGEEDGWEEQSEQLNLLRVATENHRGSAAEGRSKMKRLIGWHCEVMMPLLKMIVARRQAEKNRKAGTESKESVAKLERDIGSTNNVLDEVEEVINLPEFDSKVQKKVKSDPYKVKLGPEVEAQLREYVTVIASLYRDNPFHNFEHASHVCMSTMKLLSRIVSPDEVIDMFGKKKKTDIASSLHDYTFGITSDPLTQFSVVLSALIHDCDHRGIPNFLLIEEDPELVAVYHNKSVAEQNSVDIAWEALMDPRFEALRSCIYSNEDELKRFRQLLVNSVMSTDIFDKELSALRKDRWNKAFKVPDSVATQKDINRKATIVIEHIVQASDVSHTMQHWHVYKKWNERLFQELYTAYRHGRSGKDPSEGWYQGEIGFFDNYVIPLAKKLKDCGVFGVSSDEYLNYAVQNRNEWEAKGKEIVENMIDKYSVMMDIE